MWAPLAVCVWPTHTQKQEVLISTGGSHPGAWVPSQGLTCRALDPTRVLPAARGVRLGPSRGPPRFPGGHPGDACSSSLAADATAVTRTGSPWVFLAEEFLLPAGLAVRYRCAGPTAHPIPQRAQSVRQPGGPRAYPEGPCPWHWGEGPKAPERSLRHGRSHDSVLLAVRPQRGARGAGPEGCGRGRLTWEDRGGAGCGAGSSGSRRRLARPRGEGRACQDQQRPCPVGSRDRRPLLARLPCTKPTTVLSHGRSRTLARRRRSVTHSSRHTSWLGLWSLVFFLPQRGDFV